MIHRIIILMIFPCLLMAQTKAWLIGGGNTLDNSQDQIEANVGWLQQSFNTMNIDVSTYFTNGHGTGHDVIFMTPADSRDRDWETIQRVYGKGLDYTKSTRRNTLGNIKGSTDAGGLPHQLSADFSTLTPADSLLFVYNGHGDMDPSDTRLNSLKLWNDTRLPISQLNELFSHAPKTTPVRFVFTQCFSGSFNQLIYSDPFSNELNEQSRCGFMSESDTREAEGCELGLSKEEYRDYSTFFFAALQGVTRLGEKIPATQLDLDQSGSISYFEAHLYSLGEAYSSDLSRSTSESFLESWVPWFLRWDSFSLRNTKNQYNKIATHVAETNNLPAAGPLLVWNKHKLHLNEQDLTNSDEYMKKEIKALQQAIRTRHPLDENTIKRIGTLDSRLFTDTEKNNLAKTLSTDIDYAKLASLQDKSLNEAGALLEAKRKTTQAEKALRLRKLARLNATFELFANSDSKKDMNRIIHCEAGTLN